jgi:hypothetical protein
MKTSELTGAALDWAVAMAENWAGADFEVKPYSTDWAQGGPILERERFIRIAANVSGGFTVSSKIVEIQDDDSFNIRWVHGVGPTPLIAAMRCYVASKLGDEVEIPEGL